MVAPVTFSWINPISKYFPKRLLLPFLVVCVSKGLAGREGGLSWAQISRCSGEVQSLPLIAQGGDRPSLAPGIWATRSTGRGCRDTQLSPHSLGVPTSMRGMEPRTSSSMLESPQQPPTAVKSLMAYLANTVFPAPDSPLMMRDWFFPNLPGRDRGAQQTHHLPEGPQPLPSAPPGVLPGDSLTSPSA